MYSNLKLLRSRILVNANNKFDVQLKMMTKSKGIDFILNFLSGDAFYVAFRVLALHGKFFNFSKSDIKNHGNIGKYYTCSLHKHSFDFTSLQTFKCIV